MMSPSKVGTSTLRSSRIFGWLTGRATHLTFEDFLHLACAQELFLCQLGMQDEQVLVFLNVESGQLVINSLIPSAKSS